MHVARPLVLALLLLSVGCRTVWVEGDLTAETIAIDHEVATDEAIDQLIAPYRTDLDAEMNVVIARAARDLTKARPEGRLGNLMTRAMASVAASETGLDIDVAIMNFGGIRIPQLAEGPVTVGRVYELMPFDNFLVVQHIPGAVLDSVLQSIAKRGGWPVRGASFVIRDGRATDIRIDGAPLDPDQTYAVALSDYLANGGDRLDLLRRFHQVRTPLFLRDAFIRYFRAETAAGRPLDAELTGSIRHAD